MCGKFISVLAMVLGKVSSMWQRVRALFFARARNQPAVEGKVKLERRGGPKRRGITRRATIIDLEEEKTRRCAKKRLRESGENLAKKADRPSERGATCILNGI